MYTVHCTLYSMWEASLHFLIYIKDKVARGHYHTRKITTLALFLFLRLFSMSILFGNDMCRVYKMGVCTECTV